MMGHFLAMPARLADTVRVSDDLSTRATSPCYRDVALRLMCGAPGHITHKEVEGALVGERPA